MLRRRRGRVESVAVWVIRPPGSYRRNEISHDNVTIRVRTLVLAELSAEMLLADPLSACFAAGADPGSLSEEDLCCRVVEALRAGEASWNQWRVACVAAALQGRYKVFVSAMQQVGIKPPVVYDELSQYLEDRGYRRGRRRGLKQGLKQGREQGQAEGLQRALLITYEARFGAVPPGVIAAVEAEGDPEILLEWQVLFSTRSARAIASAIRRSGGGEAG